MGDKGTVAIEELLDAVQAAGWEVANVGARYRVTNPQGGKPCFIPQRLPKNGQISRVVDGLAKAGFDFTEAQRHMDEKRKERLEAAKAAGERQMAAAQKAIDERAAKPKPAPPPAYRRDVAAKAVAAAKATGTAAPAATGEQYTEVLMMTPELAASLLRANRFYEAGAERAGKCNRRFRQWLAEDYASKMLRGEWLLNHQGIGFDSDPTLIDGQHRLAAVIIAGEVKPDIVIPMQVTYGLTSEAMDTVDTGLKRSTADVLGMHGEVDSVLLAGTLRLVSIYDEQVAPAGADVPFVERQWRGRSSRTLSYEQARALIDAQPGIHAALATGRLLKGLSMPSAGCAVTHLIMRSWPEAAWSPFFDALQNGAGPGWVQGTGVWALREAFLYQLRQRNRKRTPHEQMALFIKGWNLHVTGKERTRLVWRVDEPFPYLLTPRDVSPMQLHVVCGSSGP